MPWTKDDAAKHTEAADTPDKQKIWAKVANSALKRCLAQGRSQSDCEASAIKQANSVIANIKESAARGYFTSGTATVEINALDVGGEKVSVGDLVAAYLEAMIDNDESDSDSELDEAMKTIDGEKFPAADFLVVEDPDKPSTWHLQVKRHGKVNRRLMGGAKAALTSPGGHRGRKYEGPDKAAAIKKLKALYKAEDMEWSEAEMIDLGNGWMLTRLEEAISGSLDDYVSRVRDAFLATFSRRSPETGYEGPWVRDVFKDNADMGDAIVATEDGTMYAIGYIEKDEGFTFDDRPKWVEVVLTYKKVGAAAAEAEFSESASLDAIADGEHGAIIMDVVKEAGIAAGEGRRSPVVVDLQIIKPGPGNKRHNRYYPAPMLKSYARVFENADIFVTDHDAKQRGEKTKVGRIKQCPVRFTDDGGPVGRTVIYDPDMAEKIRNRADSGELNTLECSILGRGDTRPGKVDGKPYDIVETIHAGPLVEFVSKAGAGGHAIALAENDTGGVNIMDKEQVKRLLSESGLAPDAQERLAGVEYESEEAVKEAILAETEQEPQFLAEAEIKKVLEATKLPQQAQKRLSEGQYQDAEALQAAIDQEIVYVKELTGSGKPFGQGGDASPSTAIMSEADYEMAYKDILKRHGLNVLEEVK